MRLETNASEIHARAQKRSARAPYLIFKTSRVTYLADLTSASDQAKTIAANKACRSVGTYRSIVMRSASRTARLNVRIHNRSEAKRLLGALITRRAARIVTAAAPYPSLSSCSPVIVDDRHRCRRCETIRRSLAFLRAAHTQP